MLFLDKHRGAASVFFYVAIMKSVLRLKRLYCQLISKDTRSEDLAARLSALRRAYSARVTGLSS
jgi:hypothetical protein